MAEKCTKETLAPGMGIVAHLALALNVAPGPGQGKVKAISHLLDIGCGSGNALFHLSQSLRCNIFSKVGIDFQDVRERQDFKFLKMDPSKKENNAQFISLFRPGLLVFWSCKLFSPTALEAISTLLFEHAEQGTIIVLPSPPAPRWG